MCVPKAGITEWLTAIGTVGAVIIAIFHDFLLDFWYKPKLNIYMDKSAPDCVKSFLHSEVAIATAAGTTQNIEGYFIRLRVKNEGRSKADCVEVFVKEVLRKESDGIFVKVDMFPPMNLLWADIQIPVLNILLPGMEKHCDIGKILDPRYLTRDKETEFEFELVVKPFTMGHIIKKGTYRAIIQVGASNAQPIERTLEIRLDGQWDSNPGVMFTRWFDIKLL